MESIDTDEVVSVPLLPKNDITIEKFREDNDYKPINTKSHWIQLKGMTSCTTTQCLKLIPILTWIRTYNVRKDLIQDLAAGLTVCTLHTAHGMAYAPLGGQPPVAGLYMAVFPSLMYIIFGTSRHISLGMFAPLCLMVGHVVEKHLDSGYTSIEVGTAVCFVVGLWQLLLGILHFGAFTALLGNSMISGFTSAAAVHVFIVQLKGLLGIPNVKMQVGPLKIVYTCYYIIKDISNTNLVTLAMSIGFIFFLCFGNEKLRPFLLRYCRFAFPNELLAIVIGIVLSFTLDLNGIYDVQVVGHIPQNLPMPKLPTLSLVTSLLLDCLIIAIVNSVMNLSLATIFSKKVNMNIDGNQELMAYGIANMFGSFFECIPICGSLSRTQVQYSVGGKTQFTSLFSLISVLIVLISLGGLFSKVPLCVLASIVVVTLKGLLMKVTEFPRIWRQSKADGILWIMTFTSVVLLDLDYGIAAGFTATMFILAFNVYRNNVLFGISSVSDEVHKIDSVFKIIAHINFTNCESIKKKILKHVKIGSKETNRCINLDLSCVPDIDPSSISMFITLYHDLSEQGVQLFFINCPTNVYNTLTKCNFWSHVPKDCFLVINLNITDTYFTK